MKDVKLIVRIKADSKKSYVLVVDSCSGKLLFNGNLQGFRFWLDDFQNDYNINYIY